MNSSYQRKPRFTLKLQMVFDDGNSFMSGPVVDMSETGVFIETVMPLPPDTKVRLMPLFEDEQGLVELQGVVARKADYDLDNFFDRTPGMGVRFTDLNEEQQTFLADLLRRGRSVT
jgi:uncharacterized protein (TIGR02266 family)